MSTEILGKNFEKSQLGSFDANAIDKSVPHWRYHDNCLVNPPPWQTIFGMPGGTTFSLESGRKCNSRHSQWRMRTATNPRAAAVVGFDDATAATPSDVCEQLPLLGQLQLLFWRCLRQCAMFTKHYRKYSLRPARYRYGTPHIYYYCICLHMIK